jgi:hypothetical protein
MTPVARTLASPAQGSPAAAHPLRMAFVYSPNGKNMERWLPSGSGTDYQLSPSLAPLAPLRSDFQIVSGLDHQKAEPNGDGGGAHARASATFLTGCQAQKTSGADIRAGQSVDQLAAEFVGPMTKLSSLELSCDEVRSSGACDSGYSCAYQYNISWRTESMPMAPEVNPRLVFERLFGNQFASQVEESQGRRRLYQKSILDFVKDDARRLQKKLGSTDRSKLNEYLTGVRELEKRIEKAERFAGVLPNAQAPAGIPESYQEHLRLMFDLMALAFQTDTTRIASFLMAHDGSVRAFPEIGVRAAHHGLSHHQKNPERLEALAKIDRFYSEQHAHFLKTLSEMPEGEGSVLDNCMIVLGAGIADPDAHAHSDLPIILAGGGSGTLQPGRHVAFQGQTPMTNLYLSMLERMGIQHKRFGDSTGPLPGL